MEVDCPAYHNWCDLNLKSHFVMLYDGLFERFVDVVYVVYVVHCVVVSGVLALYELEASPSLYVVSSRSCPLEFLLYPIALMMPGL